jgi:hypothetical protein
MKDYGQKQNAPAGCNEARIYDHIPKHIEGLFQAGQERPQPTVDTKTVVKRVAIIELQSEQPNFGETKTPLPLTRNF